MAKSESVFLRDIETKEDYAEYETRVKMNTRGMDHLSTGPCPGCDSCGLSEDPTDEEYEFAAESWFSWRPCTICQRDLGGDREYAHYADSDDQICHITVCIDCVYYLEYGCLDDQTMAGIEDSAV